MLRLPCFSAMLLAASGLLAQSAGTPARLVVISGQGCPVNVTAQRNSPFGLVQTGNSTPPPLHGYLYLHFAPGKAHSIVAATVVLHGTDNTPRAELASSHHHDADLTETFQLTGPLSDSQVAPKSVANVRWVGIDELRYADGTTWRPSETAFCHIQPNGFQLVDAEAK